MTDRGRYKGSVILDKLGTTLAGRSAPSDIQGRHETCIAAQLFPPVLPAAFPSLLQALELSARPNKYSSLRKREGRKEDRKKAERKGRSGREKEEGKRRKGGRGIERNERKCGWLEREGKKGERRRVGIDRKRK